MNFRGNGANMHSIRRIMIWPVLLVVVMASAGRGAFAAATMVTDINTTLPANSSSPSNITRVNLTVFFTANDGNRGTELWKTDGSTVTLVKDIFPGSGSSGPANLAAVGSTLFFTANNGVNGTELWKSDGTEEGTVLVADIRPGSTSTSGFGFFTEFNGMLYFAVGDGINGTELWRSDGTSAGTVIVKDILAGTGSSSPASLTVVNFTTGARLMFSAQGPNGRELYVSTGAVGNASEVTDIFLGASNSNPSNFTVVNLLGSGPTLFFTATNVLSGTELWKSDGTGGGTALVLDIVAGAGSSSPINLVAMGTKLFFSATEATNGRELWSSDGTTTARISQINAGAGSSSPSNLANVNGILYFTATDGGAATGTELYKTDGTTVSLVKDITVGTTGTAFSSLVASGSQLIFVSADATNGVELWKSDGSSAGTGLVKDIYAGVTNSNPAGLVDILGTVYFRATDTSGTELWKSNGTTAGTVQISNINPDAGNSSPNYLTDVNGTLFFSADDGVNGYELWKSNGTPAGTTMVKNIVAGALSSYPSYFVNAGGTLYFIAFDGTFYQLWKSDGTDLGTIPVSPAVNGQFDGLVAFNGAIIFNWAPYDVGADDYIDYEPYIYDPQTTLTTQLKDIYPGTADGSYPYGFTVFNGEVYFQANDGANGYELWKTNGTPGGTVLVADTNPGAASSYPYYFTAANGALYFRATDGTTGDELWKTDGTLVGTVLVKDINPGASSSNPYGFAGANGTVFFQAFDGTNGFELWKTDGTGGGTVMVKDINPGTSSSNPNYMTAANGGVVFQAYEPSAGYELWFSDGTDGGTHQVIDIASGTPSSFPSYILSAVSGIAVFSAQSPTYGSEMWKSNGSSLNTAVVDDIVSGSGSSTPQNFVVSGSNVFFSATNGVNGRELWVVPLSAFDYPAPTLTSLSPSSATEGDAGFTLTVNGTNFSSTSVVRFNGVDLPTVVSSTVLATATISADKITVGGEYDVTVFTSTPGGGESTAQTFDVEHRVPTLASVSPTSATAAGAAFTLTATGTNFSPNSVVQWNGSDRVTTFVSTTQITAAITAADIATGGAAVVKVVSPNPGGGTTAELSFTINYPVPTLTSLDPTTVSDGIANFTLNVTGTKFFAASVVHWNGTPRTTTFISSTKLSAAIASADVDTAGIQSVTVVNPSPAGGTSNSVAFQVGTVPAISSALSTSGLAGAKLNYAVTASGSKTITYTVTGLPAGLTFSDGAISGTLTDIGSFNITLKAENVLGSDTETLVLTVEPVPQTAGTSNSTLDSDADGFSDEIETDQGTSPLSASSTPFDGAVAGTPESLFISKLGVGLNFGKPGNDSLSASGILTVPAGFAVSGAKVVVDIGGVVKSFTLDAKGSSPKATDTFKLSVKATKGVVAAQSSKFSVKYSKGTWQALFTDEGLANDTVSNVPKTVPVVILFNSKVFKADVAQLYSAKKDSTGKTKLPSTGQGLTGR